MNYQEFRLLRLYFEKLNNSQTHYAKGTLFFLLLIATGNSCFYFFYSISINSIIFYLIFPSRYFFFNYRYISSFIFRIRKRISYLHTKNQHISYYFIILANHCLLASTRFFFFHIYVNSY